MIDNIDEKRNDSISQKGSKKVYNTSSSIAKRS